MEAYGTLCSALAAHAPAARDWASLFLDVGAAAPKWPCGCALALGIRYVASSSYRSKRTLRRPIICDFFGMM